MDRLRQVDVKAEHFERQVQRVEQERDMWEKKYEVCVEHQVDFSCPIQYLTSSSLQPTGCDGEIQ